MRLAFLLLLLAGCAAAEAPESDTTAMEEQAATREVIATDGAPAAIGPYSQAVRVGNTLYCAGQIGLDPATGQLVEGGIEAETRRALDNQKAVLEAAGFTLNDVVQAQVFLADLGDYSAMNEVYATYFTKSPPARAAVQVARLPRDARVEIMLTAAK
ncbi:MAG TPA: RidA family protein [Rhodothermales bacterium]|nr:RidA family protein [Rhodothermales bacterium]